MNIIQTQLNQYDIKLHPDSTFTAVSHWLHNAIKIGKVKFKKYIKEKENWIVIKSNNVK